MVRRGPVGTDPSAALIGRVGAFAVDEGVMSVKKVLAWLVLAFALFYVIQAPEASAQFVRSAGQALGDAAQSLAAFVGSLV